MPGGKRRYWIAASLLLVLATSVLFFLTSSGRKSILTQTLPDGTVVTILKVSYGKVYKLTVGNSWQRFAGQILPGKFAQKIGIRTLTITNATAATFIYVDYFNPSPVRPPVRTGPAPVPSLTGLGMFANNVSPYLAASSLVLSNGVGDETFLDANSGHRLASNHVVEVFKLALNSHDRKQLKIRLNYYDPTRSAYGASEFITRNPASRVPPRWTVPALPQTNGSGDLQVVLLELHSYSNPLPPPIGQSPPIVTQPGVNLWTSARIQILQNGAPSRDWTIASVQVEDEEGNVYKTRSVFNRDFNYPGDLHFEGGFSPRETRKFVFTVAPAIPNHLDQGRDIAILARPSPAQTNASSAR